MTIDKSPLLPERPAMKTELDERDLRILEILSREGRISKTELARRVNLSVSPCWERLKRLEQAGLIRGYRADIALAEVVRCVTIFVAAELETHRASDFQTFERALSEREEVVACWAVGGGMDYLIQIVIEDIDRYQRFIDTLLGADIGLKRYYTYVVTKTITDNPTPPARLLRARQKE